MINLVLSKPGAYEEWLPYVKDRTNTEVCNLAADRQESKHLARRLQVRAWIMLKVFAKSSGSDLMGNSLM